MNNTTIGIDPSLNSTGICVVTEDKTKYYNIVSKMTKKMQTFKSPHVVFLPYEKRTSNETYTEKEASKTYNIYCICKHIKNILMVFHPKRVVMEGVSYGSVGSAALVDLSGLNFAIRMILEEMKIEYEIVPPTAMKKFATGNGQAEKEIIINAWKRLDCNISDIKDIKVDDLADSYFLAHYQSNT